MLYIVGTPIGNLGDWSERACAVLKNVDVVAAEDTREARKLFNHFGIQTPLVSYHTHNARAQELRLLERLRGGETVALISDAGMPGISDPGEYLIKAAIAAGIPVCTVPGPTALITALVASGLPTGRFVFEGFLPRDGRLRRRALRELRTETRTVVFYEAPHRLCACLNDLCEIWGAERQGVVARELTKLHEEFIRGTLAALREHFETHAARGECVLVMHGAQPEPEQVHAGYEAELMAQLANGLKVSDAVKAVVKSHGVSRDVLYRLAVTKKRSETPSD